MCIKSTWFDSFLTPLDLALRLPFLCRNLLSGEHGPFIYWTRCRCPLQKMGLGFRWKVAAISESLLLPDKYILCSFSTIKAETFEVNQQQGWPMTQWIEWGVYSLPRWPRPMKRSRSDYRRRVNHNSSDSIPSPIHEVRGDPHAIRFSTAPREKIVLGKIPVLFYNC